MPSESLNDWLAREPFTLALSSGFFGFYAHAGFVSSLIEHGHVPVALSGSSAGALIGGLLAAGKHPEEIRAELTNVERKDFWDPSLGLGVLRGAAFDRVLRRMIGFTRIERCVIPLQIAVFDIHNRRTRVVTEGDLATAIRASCAFPGLFQPVTIGGNRYLDGGILDRPGLCDIKEGARTLHHHLASKSPWRRVLPKTVEAPTRRNQVTVVIHNLPRSGPLRLENGRLAMTHAMTATRAVLREYVTSGVVELTNPMAG